MRQATIHFVSLAIATMVYFSGAPAALAVTYLPSGWVSGANQGNGPIFSADTNHPIVGDQVDDPTASSNAADAEELHSPFTPITLAADGDKITFTGTVLLQGTVNSIASSGTPRTQFRFGLFQDNGSADNLGWLGYLMTNTHGTGTPNGTLSRKNTGNTSTYLSTTGSTALGASGGNGTVFNDDTFTLSLSIERAVGGLLSLDGSITGTTTTNFSEVLHGGESAAGVVTYTFDRLGFLMGANLDTDRAEFSDLAVTATGPSFTVEGDYNGNGVVDADDYVVWRKNVGGAGGSVAMGDHEPDGDVDNDDYAYFQARFGNGGPGSGNSLGASSVPEPTSMVLTAMTAAVMLIAVRRHSRMVLEPARRIRSR
jgi:hypothetical protein